MPHTSLVHTSSRPLNSLKPSLRRTEPSAHGIAGGERGQRGREGKRGGGRREGKRGEERRREGKRGGERGREEERGEERGREGRGERRERRGELHTC